VHIELLIMHRGDSVVLESDHQYEYPAPNWCGTGHFMMQRIRG
jgi:hypothetical protein